MPSLKSRAAKLRVRSATSASLICAGLALAALAGCTPKTSVQCVKAVIEPGVGAVVADGRAGFVQFDFQREGKAHVEKSQCTALFDAPTGANGATDAARYLRVWTAAHCVGRDLGDLVAVTAFLHTRSGLVEVPLGVAYIDAKAKAASHMMLNHPNEKGWRKAFDWNLALERDPVHAPACRNAEGRPATDPKVAGTQDVCASWSDLLVLPASVAEEDWNVLRASLTLVDFREGMPRDVKDYLDAHEELVQLKREHAVAQDIDALFLCQSQPGKCAASHIAAKEDLLRNFVFVGRDPLLEATRAGYGTSSKSYAALMAQRIVATRATIEGLWKPIAERVRQKPTSGVVITSSKRTFDFKAVAFSAFLGGGRHPEFRVEGTGLRVVSPVDALKIRFEKGDSGSIVTLDGVAPLLALQSVDNEETSGGASVVALPARRPSQDASPVSNASGNRQGRMSAGDSASENKSAPARESASSDCGQNGI